MEVINWYPGHMAKSRRMLAEQLRAVDAVIELCDARAPGATRNPDLDAMARGKARLLILNKADLAEDAATAAWLQFYKRAGLEAMKFDSAAGNPRDAIARITRLTAPAVDRMKARGVNKIIRAMVVGIPNVGKSTYINKLFGRAAAVTGDKPGVTRGRQWVKIGPYLELLDTPGMLWPKLSDQSGARMLAYLGSVRDQALDAESLAEALLSMLMGIAPAAVTERYKLERLVISPTIYGRLIIAPTICDAVTGDSVVSLLERACAGRGWLLPGGRLDTHRGAALVLDEFRAGKLGKITLEWAADAEGDDNKGDG